MKRRVWDSENGKYRVLVRKFEDGSIDVGCWTLSEQGKTKYIRSRNLPAYVVAKIEELKREVN